MSSSFVDNGAEAYAAGFHIVTLNNNELIDHKYEYELTDAMVYYDLKVERFYSDYERFKNINVVLYKVGDNRIDKLCEFGNSKL